MTADPQGLSAEKLKPCPFCGGAARRGEWTTFYIECLDCNARQIGLTKAEAVTAWNTRSEGPQPPAVKVEEGVRERVAAILRDLSRQLQGWAPDSDPAISARKRAADAILTLLGSRHEG